MTLSEPKLAKKLIVSLILRKPKMATAEKRIDKIMEIMRRVLAFLKKARKRLTAVRKTIPTIMTMRYLVGRILRRKRLTRRAIKEIPATQARILAIRLSLFLVDLGFWDIVSFVAFSFGSVVSFDSVADFTSVIGSDLVVDSSMVIAATSLTVSSLIGSSADTVLFFWAIVFITRLVVDLGEDFFPGVAFLIGLFKEVEGWAVFLIGLFEEVEDLVVFLVFFFTELIVLLMLLL